MPGDRLPLSPTAPALTRLLTLGYFLRRSPRLTYISALSPCCVVRTIVYTNERPVKSSTHARSRHDCCGG
jgi:hypothetical protein